MTDAELIRLALDAAAGAGPRDVPIGAVVVAVPIGAVVTGLEKNSLFDATAAFSEAISGLGPR